MKAYAALFIALTSATVIAAEVKYPVKPIRFIVPYAAGGSTDMLARVVGQQLGERMGQQIVIDNRSGAGTIIGTEIAAHAVPDGYTLLMATPPLAVNPALYGKVPYDFDRDFTAVTNVAGSTNLLVVHPSVPAQSVKELVALLKANPGKYNYGSSGVGGASHLATALFVSMAAADAQHVHDMGRAAPLAQHVHDMGRAAPLAQHVPDMGRAAPLAQHVPYKGGAPAVADLVAGRVNFMMANLTTAQPHIRANRLRGLGVGTRARSPLFPEMPTIAEAGVPGYEANNWNGVVAPRKTPRAIVERLHREIVAIVSDPAVAKRLAAQGLEPIGDTPAEFEKYLKSEAVKWGKVVKAAGIKPD